ncbi:MAG: YihY/virulence factor BrkB family protein [Propionibacteriales bacterium]|nr:YihY/virulence factor BrkB family protein [Propionibacteriales bacterium]
MAQDSGLVAVVKERFARLRERRPFVEHVVRTVQHYGAMQGTVLAGAVTFFGFLSFFPILALGFFVVGWVATVYPNAEQDLVTAITDVLPGLIGDQPGQISIDTFKNAGGAAGLIGLIGLLYSGLGWLSGMRAALQQAFVVPAAAKRNLVLGKAVDLVVLAAIGVTLIVSVALTGLVATVLETILGWLQLDAVAGMGLLFRALAVLLGLAASTALFFVMYRLLANPQLPRGAVLKGAVLAGIGFEVLKNLAWLLIAQASSSPAAAVLGISLVLLVWINYFSRVTMLGAAWAYTDPVAAAQRAVEAQARELDAGVQYVAVSGARPLAAAMRESQRQRRVDRISLASGVAIGAVSAGLASILRRRA